MKFALFPAALLSLALAAPAFAAPAAPADGLEMVGSNPKKVVKFNHSTHKDIECTVCHHPVDGKENFAKCATAGCHDDLAGKKGTKSLYYVVHSKKNVKFQSCLQCHDKIVAEKPDLKKDLTGCAKSKCHP